MISIGMAAIFASQVVAGDPDEGSTLHRIEDDLIMLRVPNNPHVQKQTHTF